MRVIKFLEKSQPHEIIGIFEKYFLNEDQANFDEQQFKVIIDFLIQLINKVGCKDNDMKTKLKITVNPFKYLDQNVDFGLFYERESE